MVSPVPVRMQMLLELPNLRRALDMWIESGKLAEASEMASHMFKFLMFFGRWQEYDALLKRLNEAILTYQSLSVVETLTRIEWLHETALGEKELEYGNIQAALIRFTNLLIRIKTQPADVSIRCGSYEHYATLTYCARCYAGSQQLQQAEELLRQAQSILDTLINQQPSNQQLLHARAVLLTDIGQVLLNRGRPDLAQQVYEEAVQLLEQTPSDRQRAVVFTELGRMALSRKDFVQAVAYYIKARDLYLILNEPDGEAVVWHQLGTIAQEQQEWNDAESCYRMSLELRTRSNQLVFVASTCTNLAIVVSEMGRLDEAERWLRQALSLYEQVLPGSYEQNRILNNLAMIILKGVLAGQCPRTRLIEAQTYAKRALEIRETGDDSSQIWQPQSLLADIAELEGQTEIARLYRRQARESFAAFTGNRHYIDTQFSWHISDVAIAAKGSLFMRQVVENYLPTLEAKGWHITEAIQRIWAGERDWFKLSENLNNLQALLVLRILETIETLPPSVYHPLDSYAMLPASLREAKDQAAFEQALETLLPTEIVPAFESLLRDIVEAFDNSARQVEIEPVLVDLETKGWQLRCIAQRIWAGERDPAVLTRGLDTRNILLAQRILNIIADA